MFIVNKDETQIKSNQIKSINDNREIDYCILSK